jgi:hypothetical protein
MGRRRRHSNGSLHCLQRPQPNLPTHLRNLLHCPSDKETRGRESHYLGLAPFVFGVTILTPCGLTGYRGVSMGDSAFRAIIG